MYRGLANGVACAHLAIAIMLTLQQRQNFNPSMSILVPLNMIVAGVFFIVAKP